MFGLDFQLPTFVTATYSAVLGGLITLAISAWATRETRERLDLLLDFLESVTFYEHGKESGVPVIVRDPETGELQVGARVSSKTTVSYEHLGPDGETDSDTGSSE